MQRLTIVLLLGKLSREVIILTSNSISLAMNVLSDFCHVGEGSVSANPLLTIKYTENVHFQRTFFRGFRLYSITWTMQLSGYPHKFQPECYRCATCQLPVAGV